MIECHLLPQKGNQPQRVLTKFKNELELKIKIILLNSFTNESLPLEELAFKQVTLKNDKKLKSSVAPLSKGILPQNSIDYICSLHSRLCLDDKSDLGSLWAVDIHTRFKKIYDITVGCKYLELPPVVVKELKNNFIALTIKYNVLACQTSLKMTTGKIIEGLIERYRDCFIQIHSTIDKIQFLKNKVSDVSQKFKTQTAKISDSPLKNQFIEIQAQAENVTNLFKEQISSMGVGLSLYGNTYLYKYLHEMELGKLVSKHEPCSLTHENISKINQFINACKTGWKHAGNKHYIGLIPCEMANVGKFLVTKDFTAFNPVSIMHISGTIKDKLFNLQSMYEKITLLHFRSMKQSVSWEGIKKEWVTIDKGNPVEIEDSVDLRCPVDWLSEAVCCVSLANSQLMTVHRMFENVVCKNKIPGYVSFDELCFRLTNNFKTVFAERKEILSTVQNTNNPLDILIVEFKNDLAEINRQFEAKIYESLPSPEVIDYCISKFSLLKESLISKETLLPFRPAVIFAATSILPAIKKAHKWLFKRFNRSLKNIAVKEIEDIKEILIERLQGQCFLQMKPLLELLVTIRDIQAVLLDHKECSKEMAEGLHLIPEEFANLLQPHEISGLIELYIKSEPDEKQEMIEEASFLIDFSEEENQVEELIPALQNISTQTAHEILETLHDSRSFQVQKGEKTSKILKRLRELGAYFLREGKGSHSIWAHPNTDVTFSIPHGEDLSRGVSKKLEEWVNRHIFKTID